MRKVALGAKWVAWCSAVLVGLWTLPAAASTSTTGFEPLSEEVLTGEASLSPSGRWMAFAVAHRGQRRSMVTSVDSDTSDQAWSLDDLLQQPVAFGFWQSRRDRLVVMTTPQGDSPRFFLVDPRSRRFEPVPATKGKVPVYVHHTGTNGYAAPVLVLAKPGKGRMMAPCRISQRSGRCMPVSGQFPVIRLQEYAGRPSTLEVRLSPQGESWRFGAKGRWHSSDSAAHDSGYGTPELVGAIERQQTIFIREAGPDGTLQLTRWSATSRSRGSEGESDVVAAMFSPEDGDLQAYVSEGLEPRWTVVDDKLASAFDALLEDPSRFPWVVGRSADDSRWLIRLESAQRELGFAIFDRRVNRLRNVALTAATRVTAREPRANHIERTFGVWVPGAEGKPIPAYLTVPPVSACPSSGCPLVVDIHGGPHFRDRAFHTPEREWWNSLGYAVLNVNFRGSTGFGLPFAHAIRKEWGGLAVHDVLAAIDWVKAHSDRIDPSRIAVVGESYGGFAALAAAVQSPGVARCVAAKSAVSDLGAYVRHASEEKQDRASSMKQDIGDPAEPVDSARLDAQSVLGRHQLLQAPTLLIHGQKDDVTPITNVQELVYQLRPRRHRFAFVTFPEEGHRFSHPAQVAFRNLTADFLSSCMDHRPSPDTPPVLALPEGVSIRIRDGAHLFPGLRARCGGIRREAHGLGDDSSCRIDAPADGEESALGPADAGEGRRVAAFFEQ